MYSLKEAWSILYDKPPVENWDGKFACLELNADVTLATNITRGMMSCYTYNIVTAGKLHIICNGRETLLVPDDIYIYMPGLEIEVLSVSDDFHAYCVLAEEGLTFETPAVYNLVRIAYQPIVQLHEPKQSLPHDIAENLCAKIREIITYLHSNHVYKDEILRMLYAIFLLELQNTQDKTISHTVVSQHVEDIFLEFIRMLPHCFIEHHDISFYASALNITPAYLSRVVRQVTGRTVIDYINRFLVLEATFLLRTSQLSIAQIADRLNFSDSASFSKFFSRMKGISPKEYRNK